MSALVATVTDMQVMRVCEVCDTEVVLTPDQADEPGWHYPPKMGVAGVISPRTCPTRLIMHAHIPRQIAKIERIRREPDDVVVLTVATHHHSEGAATRCDQFESSITVLKLHSTKIAPLIAS